MKDDDYSNMPVSLGEHRAHKEHRAELWTPRDALVNTLRRIDLGEIKPINLVIMLETDTDYHDVVATVDEDKTIALFARGFNLRFRS